MTVHPTGRITRLADRYTLAIDRTFQAPIEDVWAAITEPERLARWIGTFTGDPASGRVDFRMLFEGEADPDAAKEQMVIRECTPPRRLAVTSHVGDQKWHLDVDLSEAGGVTTLAFSHPDVGGEDLLGVGPGWEYYLDRLVAVETGGDLASLVWDRDYYPAMTEYYEAQRDAAASE